VLVGAGSLAAHARYSWYRGSAAHRAEVAASWAALCGYDVAIDGLAHDGWSGRAATNIRVIDSDIDRSILHINEARWKASPFDEQPRGQVHFHGGAADLAAHSHLAIPQIIQRLRVAIPVGLDQFKWDDATANFTLLDRRSALGGAETTCIMEDDQTVCQGRSPILNGVQLNEPIEFRGTLAGQEATGHVRFNRVPLSCFSLASAAGECSGAVSFAGNQLSVTAEARGIRLDDWSVWDGAISKLDLIDGRWKNGAWQKLELNAAVHGVPLEQVASALNWNAMDGCIDVDRWQFDIIGGRLDAMTAELAEITADFRSNTLLGRLVTGPVSIQIHRFRMEAGRCVELECEVVVHCDRPLQRDDIRLLATKAGVHFPHLPEPQIVPTEFRFGVVHRGDGFRFEGRSGVRRRALMTVELFDRELGLVVLPSGGVPVDVVDPELSDWLLMACDQASGLVSDVARLPALSSLPKWHRSSVSRREALEWTD
jgi:hypothetical protein